MAFPDDRQESTESEKEQPVEQGHILNVKPDSSSSMNQVEVPVGTIHPVEPRKGKPPYGSWKKDLLITCGVLLVLVIIVLSAGMFVISKIFPKQSPSMAAYNRGLTAEDKDELDTAVREYTQAIILRPDYAEAFYRRGFVYLRQDDPVSSLNDFNKAIKIKPDFAEAYYGRGLVYSTYDYPKAISEFDKAIELRSAFAEAYCYRGVAYFRNENLDRAIVDLDRAIRLDPKFFASYLYRGIVYAEKGDTTRAIQDFSKAIGINPNIYAAYFNRGLIYEKIGDPQAIADFKKAYYLCGNDPRLCDAARQEWQKLEQ